MGRQGVAGAPGVLTSSDAQSAQRNAKGLATPGFRCRQAFWASSAKMRIANLVTNAGDRILEGCESSVRSGRERGSGPREDKNPDPLRLRGGGRTPGLRGWPSRPVQRGTGPGGTSDPPLFFLVFSYCGMKLLLYENSRGWWAVGSMAPDHSGHNQDFQKVMYTTAKTRLRFNQFVAWVT